MSAEEKRKLKTLLGYWIEHNREHSREFREWAGKAASLGIADIGRKIARAAEEMDKATVLLVQARDRLK